MVLVGAVQWQVGKTSVFADADTVFGAGAASVPQLQVE